jgi:Co/Zn/Cd efflux system component
LLNGLFLIVMDAVLIFMGIRRLLNPADLNTGLMLVAAAGGIATKLISPSAPSGATDGHPHRG